MLTYIILYLINLIFGNLFAFIAYYLICQGVEFENINNNYHGIEAESFDFELTYFILFLAFFLPLIPYLYVVGAFILMIISIIYALYEYSVYTSKHNPKKYLKFKFKIWGNNGGDKNI